MHRSFLNEPFVLVHDGKNEDSETEEDISWKNEVQSHAASAQNKQALLNQMWRNPCLNDTYEPGSTFKIVTAAAGLEAGVVNLTDQFSCPGFRIVEDRKIRCHKVGGHGGETFLQGMMNSCNPVLIDVGQRLGPRRYYQYFKQFGLLGKTGIDLPGDGGDDHAPAGIRSDRWSWRPRLFWAVVSDHADPAHYNGILPDQRRHAHYTAHRYPCRAGRWSGSPRVCLSKRREDLIGADE